MRIRQINKSDAGQLLALNRMFGAAFSDKSYTRKPPGRNYLQQLLKQDYFIALAARDGDEIVGGLVAYELKKFEQERSELYIYDLAVAESYRRQGVATALIEALQEIGRERGAWVLFVQADTGEEDAAAIALYDKLGVREAVLHFDIPVNDP